MDTRFVCFPVRIIRLLLVLVLQLIGCQWLTSCSSADSAWPPSTPQLDETRFYPLQPGRFVVYAVTQTRYRPNQEPAVTLFQRKERVGTAFTDAAGQMAFRIERFRRAGESLPWLADSVWSARWQNGQLLRTENGLVSLSLVVPVYDQSRWNPNLYAVSGNSRNSEGRFYEIQNSYQPVAVGTVRFDQSLRVQQRADSTGLGQDKRNEIYALDVGVIYREFVHVQFCYSPDCIGQARIETGTRQQEHVLYYGIE